MKKIIGLSCGTKNGNCETFLKAAAMGAEEFGVETEIICAMALKVLPCRGCWRCREKGSPQKEGHWRGGKCLLRDDVEWILEKTVLEDAGLVLSVPCYHVRANGYFTCIHERMNHVFHRDMNVLKKTKVGAIIGVGGSGYDGWASLTLPMVNIFVQYTHILVDQIQINHCALKEWNLWMQQGAIPTSHTHLARIQDLDYDKIWELWGEEYAPVDFIRKSLERAKELGRNVARAMEMPIEQVKYLGEENAVSCPVCHCNILLVPEDLPYIYCPVCGVRGAVSTDKGKMKLEWNKEDAKNPRFSYDGIVHHNYWLREHGLRRLRDKEKVRELMSGLNSYGKIIRPSKS